MTRREMKGLRRGMKVRSQQGGDFLVLGGYDDRVYLSGPLIKISGKMLQDWILVGHLGIRTVFDWSNEVVVGRKVVTERIEAFLEKVYLIIDLIPEEEITIVQIVTMIDHREWEIIH